MDKQKLKHKNLIFILMLTTFILNAQSVRFNFTNGITKTYNLGVIRKITYNANLLNVYLINDSINTWNISTINYYDYNQSLVKLNENDVNNTHIKFEAYPNPFKDYININYQLMHEDNVKINLFDVKGQLIYEINKGRLSAGIFKDELNFSTLLPGIYNFQILSSKITLNKIIVKD
jgi:hypothetical protein